VSREVVARAPTRIDLGGGWTDVPPYCDREGGFVCNVAITRYATAHVTAARDTRDATTKSDASLVQAALARSGVSGVRVRVDNDFPVAAGLGGSSAASAATLAALSEWSGKEWQPAAIAEEGRRIEVEELGIAGGRQDHYAATFGGALALTFTNAVDVRRIPLAAKTRQELAVRSILIYTGQSRVSGETITAVLDAYEAGEARVVRALARMRELAREMAAALERADIDAVGESLNEHWEHQRTLHPSIPTPAIDAIIARARQSGALGAKAMGASGGGCVLIVARLDRIEGIRDTITPLGDILDFDIDMDGLKIVRDSA
jgi:D-glycero-alpha-D-manno-heptose-7-phosphate kinase